MANETYLQGHLQQLFDALYEMGVIEPVLESDWQKAQELKSHFDIHLKRALDQINQAQRKNSDLKQTLKDIDPQTLEYVAMEVAREYAEYQSRAQLH